MVLGVFLALLHSLQSGETSLECCQRHIGDLSEAGVRVSAAFTALSYLIRPPKAKGGKKQKKKKGGKKRQERGGDGGDGGHGETAGWPGLARLSHWRSAFGLQPAGPSSATAEAAVAAAQAAIAAHDAAAAQAEQGAARQPAAAQEPQPDAALCEDDDPFAELEDDEGPGEASCTAGC